MLAVRGGAEASPVTCTCRQLCTPTVGAIDVKRQVVLGRHDCMDRVDVLWALAGGVQPVLGELQGCIRHRPIRNFFNKVSKFSRYRGVDLWNEVVEDSADDEVGCHLYLLRCCRSDTVGHPGS